MHYNMCMPEMVRRGWLFLYVSYIGEATTTIAALAQCSDGFGASGCEGYGGASGCGGYGGASGCGGYGGASGCGGGGCY